MSDNEQILDAIGRLSHQVEVVDANVQAVRNETANLAIASVRQTNLIADLDSRVKVLEITASPPRAPATTLAEIEAEPRGAGQSIRVIEGNSKKLLNENRVFAFLILFVLPIALAVINSCHH